MEKLKQFILGKTYKAEEVSPEIIEAEQTESKIFRKHYLENLLSFLIHTTNRINGMLIEISPKISRIIIDYFAK